VKSKSSVEKLYSSVYRKVIACHIDPIEKNNSSIFNRKLFFINCQNWNISQAPKLDKVIIGIAVG